MNIISIIFATLVLPIVIVYFLFVVPLKTRIYKKPTFKK